MLATCFALIGAGAMRQLHHHVHAHGADGIHGHSGAHEHGPAGDHDHEHQDAPLPDEWACRLHDLLNAPLIATSAVPALILLGLLVAFLTQLTPPLVAQRVTYRLDCRGPPPC